MTVNEKIKEIVENFKPYFISLFIGGSQPLTFLKERHDIDVFIVSKNAIDREQCIQIYKNIRTPDIKRDFNLDFHFVEPPHLVFHYLTNVFNDNYDYTGIEDLKMKTPSLQEALDFKTEVMRCVKAKVYVFSNKENVYQHKIWYTLYMNYCIINKNSIDFTTEEIENINILKDRSEENFSKRKQIIDKLIEEVTSWQNWKMLLN